MTYRASDILLEDGPYFVMRAPKGRKGFEVFRTGITHAVRVAIIGYEGDKGLERCRQEIAKRHA